MTASKGRRATYTEATRNAILVAATHSFVDHGYAGTSLEEVALASQVTRGAVYHHFANKQALFEAALDQLGEAVMGRVLAVAQSHDNAAEATLAALNAFLDESCDPVYGKLIWQEGPLALGWEGWRRCEHDHSYALVEGMVAALMNAGYLDRIAEQTTVRVFYEMLSGAGLVIAEASSEEKTRIRDECSALIQRLLRGLLNDPATATSK